jgi:hypothetical protein
MSGDHIVPGGGDGLLKIAQYNRKAVETFEMVTAPADFFDDQYFVVYGMKEFETFNPDNIRGVWGAANVATMMARFRQDGILRIPVNAHHYGRPFVTEYETVQPLWCYFLKAEAVIHKVPKFDTEDVLKEDASDGVH